MKMLVQRPVALPADQLTLYLPNNPDERHPLYQKMMLLTCHLSGNISRTEDFLVQLPKSWRSGTRKKCESTLSKWKLYCSEGKVNPFFPTVEEGINFLGGLYDQGIG